MAKTQKSEDFSILCSSYVTVTSSDRRANAENTLSMSKSHALVCEAFVMRKTFHRLRKVYSRNLYKVGPGIEVGIPARAGYGHWCFREFHISPIKALRQPRSQSLSLLPTLSTLRGKRRKRLGSGSPNGNAVKPVLGGHPRDPCKCQPNKECLDGGGGGFTTKHF